MVIWFYLHNFQLCGSPSRFRPEVSSSYDICKQWLQLSSVFPHLAMDSANIYAWSIHLYCLRLQAQNSSILKAEHIHTYTHTHTYTQIHTFIHTYIPTLVPGRFRGEKQEVVVWKSFLKKTGFLIITVIIITCSMYAQEQERNPSPHSVRSLCWWTRRVWKV